MKFIKYLISFSFLYCSTIVFANEYKYYPASFAYDCKKANNALIPISFYEYEASSEEYGNIQNDYISELVKIAPITLRNFRKDFETISLKLDALYIPVDARIDSILGKPNECFPVTIVDFKDENFKFANVNKEYWNSLTKTWQKYYIFEFLLHKYLKNNLAAFEYRRFAFYIASGKYKGFNPKELAFFLSYHGINEMNISGISLDLNREINFDEEENYLIDAYPYPSSTFLGARLFSNKFVSFYKNRMIRALSTEGPFSLNVSGQNFVFYLDPQTPSTEYPHDDRYNSRIHFYSNGQLEEGVIESVDHFLDLVTNIKLEKIFGKKKYFKISFYENGDPRGIDGAIGNYLLFGKNVKIALITWHPNRVPYDVAFESPQDYVDSNGKVYKKILGITYDSNGKFTGTF